MVSHATNNIHFNVFYLHTWLYIFKHYCDNRPFILNINDVMHNTKNYLYIITITLFWLQYYFWTLHWYLSQKFLQIWWRLAENHFWQCYHGEQKGFIFWPNPISAEGQVSQGGCFCSPWKFQSEQMPPPGHTKSSVRQHF